VTITMHVCANECVLGVFYLTFFIDEKTLQKFRKYVLTILQLSLI
jgi:hypothetical protein